MLPSANVSIISLSENTSSQGFATEHGLSLMIEANGKRILFDMGQGKLFAENAEKLGVKIQDADFAIISHGHYDHGGGLGKFLEINQKAKVYVHRRAFEPHFSLRETGLRFIGLNPELKDSDRLVFCDDFVRIDSETLLFANPDGTFCKPIGNGRLFGPAESENDIFAHEQNLVIKSGNNVMLFAGCAHRGIVNIIRKAEALVKQPLTHVFAGMHLVKSGLSELEEDRFIATLCYELSKNQNCQYYTMHCTGTEQFLKMKSLMHNQIEYLECGGRVLIN